MKKNEQEAVELLKCKNCGEKYDPALPNCPGCGEETSANRDTSGNGALDVTQYGGGFGEGGTFHKLVSILLIGLVVILALVMVISGLGLSRENGGNTSKPATSISAGSSSGLAKDPDASTSATQPEQSTSATDPEQGTTSSTAPAESSVTKPEEPVKATKLTLDQTSVTLEKSGDTVTLNETITPADWKGEVNWSSSDPSVAEVSANGTITYVSAGTCTITAAADEVSAQCTVTCKEVAPPPAEKMKVFYTYRGTAYTELTLNNVGDGVTLEVTGGDGTYTFATSDSSVCKVSDAGKVTATGSGRCTITATDSTGKSASMSIRVR